VTDSTVTVPLRWLDDAPPARLRGGATWGVPLPRGTVADAGRLRLREAGGDLVPAQFWPLATWPDGSLKWAGCAVGALDAPCSYEIVTGQDAVPAAESPVQVERADDEIVVDNGILSRAHRPTCWPAA